MPKSVGKATITFGLVAIPTKLYSSGDGSARISFNLLSPDGRRLKQQYVDPDGRVVPHAEQKKGYEFAKGQYVSFSQEEIKAIQEPSDSAVTITSFVPDTLPPAHHDKLYYLVPEQGAEKAYELLRQALLASARVGITKHSTHGKQHLALIRANHEGIMLQHLLYADEVNSFKDVYTPVAQKISPQELAMAQKLIEIASIDTIDMVQHVDEVKQRVEAAIQAKVDGRAIDTQSSVNDVAATHDLMEALKKSLGERAA